MPERLPQTRKSSSGSDERPVANYEGWFSRLSCSACQDMFEIEDDVQNGQEVVCDSCGATLVVERTT